MKDIALVSNAKCFAISPTSEFKGLSGFTVSEFVSPSGFNYSAYAYVPKPRAEWSDPDIEQVYKDKKAMNILFNGVDGDMFDNIINYKTAKDVWDTIQVICDGTEQISTRGMETHDSLIKKFLRLQGIHLGKAVWDSKDYELEIEQDEKLEKGRKKGGSIALVAEQGNEKEIKVHAVESAPNRRVYEGKRKGLVA
ncbi:hypothetical protein AgCh_000533 [Apium graveolens]